MADPLFSNLTNQATLATTKFFCESNLVVNTFAQTTGADILAYLATAGLLTQTQIEALTSLQLPNLYFGGGELSGATATITLNSGLIARDATNAKNIVLASGFTGLTSSNFAAGTGNGKLDTGSIAANKQYYIWAICTSAGVSDLLFSLSKTSPTMPATYTLKRLVGCFKMDFQGAIYAESVFNYYQLLTFGESGKPLPFNYVTPGFSITETSTVLATFGFIEARDDTNTVNIRTQMLYTNGYDKKLNNKFAAGHENGLMQTAIAINTTYYVYIICKANGAETDFVASVDNPSTITLPSGFLYKRCIGFIQTLAATTSWYAWTVNEKWEDVNFDIANLAKATSVEADAPTYEDLFGCNIKVATFSPTTANYVSMGVEYPHGGKVNAPLLFHCHVYPENTNTGNYLLTLDYAIINDGTVISATSETQITKLAAASGTAGLSAMVNFDALTGLTLNPGTQIWFRFGRLATDGTDTFTGKLAIRTFGFHYISKGNGSDLLATNL